jgi:SAM-dependent methyltransferase
VSKISEDDILIYKLVRENVRKFQTDSLSALIEIPDLILDIAPQDHETLSSLVHKDSKLVTLDIEEASGATYISDIVKMPEVPDNKFDIVFCTEVLEHVRDPFSAVREIWRVLKPGGFLFASSPFNFRIHGPLPDNWRFTEHGWRVLLQDFESVTITQLEDEKRFLMPFHYTAQGQKPKT